MNYLAHLYLAEDSPESLIGNFLGDFVKGQNLDRYSNAVKKGIIMHRKVDVYTDSHAVVRESKRSIGNINKRYAGIVIDVFYDHFLAKNWVNYSAIALSEFSAKVYGILQQNEKILPVAVRTVLPAIIADNRLMSYADIKEIGIVLKKISLRLKRENSLEEAIEDLKANYDRLESEFGIFFPQLVDYVCTLRENL